MNKYLEIRRNSAFNQVCGEDPIPRMTVTVFFKRIGSRTIKFENASPPGKQALISHNQVNCVEDIIVTRDRENLGMSRPEVKQTISDIWQASPYVQA